MNAAKSIVTRLNKLNRLCKHNEFLAKVLTPARVVWRKLGIGRYLTRIVNENDPQYQQIMRTRREEHQSFYALHEQQIGRVAEMLEDDFSRQTLDRVMEYRRTGDVSALKSVCVQNQYFQTDIFGPVKDEVFVDGGAYIGDTIESFLEKFAWGGGTKGSMLGNQMKPIWLR